MAKTAVPAAIQIVRRGWPPQLQAQLGAHAHVVNDPGHAHVLPVLVFGCAAGGAAAASGTNPSKTGVSVANAGGNETRRGNVALNYIIKE